MKRRPSSEGLARVCCTTAMPFIDPEVICHLGWLPYWPFHTGQYLADRKSWRALQAWWAHHIRAWCERWGLCTLAEKGPSECSTHTFADRLTRPQGKWSQRIWNNRTRLCQRKYQGKLQPYKKRHFACQRGRRASTSNNKVVQIDRSTVADWVNWCIILQPVETWCEGESAITHWFTEGHWWLEWGPRQALSHNRLTTWLLKQAMKQRPERFYYTSGQLLEEKKHRPQGKWSQRIWSDRTRMCQREYQLLRGGSAAEAWA